MTSTGNDKYHQGQRLPGGGLAAVHELRYEFEEEQRPPMWGWKRIVIVSLVAVALVVATFLGGYFRGIEVGKRMKDSNGGNFSGELFDSEWQRLPCITPDYKCPEDFQEAPLLLISLDGFRPDYLERRRNPSLERLAQCGVKAPFMRPVFPTKTFPNHFTIVTGLWPESHGIVDNKMYDPELKTLFKLGNKESFKPRWWEGEPIWVTVEKQGKKAATFFWPGSDVKIHDIRPSYYFKYNEKIPWQSRVEIILAWLDLPSDRRPSFMSLYVNEPDNAGHDYGPHSEQVDETLELLEIMLDRLMAGLQERNLLGCVNILIVSDHGMTSISCDQVIALDRYVDPSSFYSLVGASARINPKASSKFAVGQLVEMLRCRHEHLLVYAKERLPKRYHYSNHRRIEPIVFDMDSGYIVLNKMADKNPDYCSGGAHGYDNMAPSMQGIFLGHGPAFKQNVTVRPFRNIELYEMMAQLLKITPRPNNGTRGSLHYLLRHRDPLPELPHPPVPPQCYVTLTNGTENGTDEDDGCMCKSDARTAASHFGFDRKTHDTTRPFHALHVPWGDPALVTPGMDAEEQSQCLLTNHDYVATFHKDLRLPLWSAYTLRGRQESAIANACWERDARLHAADLTCKEYEALRTATIPLVKEALFPPDFVSAKEHEQSVWLHSNALPFYRNHSTGVRREFIRLIKHWEAKYGSLNVVMGPAFDVHGSGRRPPLQDILDTRKPGSPVAVPSHIFSVLTRCRTAGVSVHACIPSHLNVIAFLLPHLPRPENCQAMNQYLVQHMATVGDVELLTGLQFFSELPVYEAIRLRTEIPEGLWPT